ncbi:MAG: cobalamin-dependent protein [Actinomycetota bacterium]|nr:cobalamin-dependent protein [Actinomycetota bacterium]
MDMSPNGEELVPLDEAARRLGVHYMTAYRRVRVGRLPAVQHHGRWFVPATALADPPAQAPEPLGRVRRASGERREHLTERLLAGDAAGCWLLIEQALASGRAPEAIYVELLGPALCEIGRRWERGEIGVEREHRASAVALRLAGQLAPRFVRPGRKRHGAVLLAGAPGDFHLLPLVMVADVVRGHGYVVHDLGANVPERSLLAAVEATADLAVIGLSVSCEQTKRAAERAVQHLHRSVPGVPVLLGGPALASEDASLALGADGWAPDASGAARLIEERTG